MAKKVVIGMSGGVDSSVAACLLKKQGYDVIGVTMQIWQDEDDAIQEENGGCCGLSAVDDARRVAHQLGIPYYVMNFKKEFKENVIDYFIHEYLEARTPNPCIACNRYVKWEALLKRSLEIGADYIATGHYARVVKLPNGRFTLQQSATLAKDQTYALYNLTQEQLSHTLMPVGDYTKDQIREIAEEAGLPVAAKPDSQEICFIPDDDYAKYITDTTGEKIQEGNFVDLDGNILGRHKGIIHYTIGQRKGLGLAMGRPVFVVDIRKDTNEVVIGENEDVFAKGLIADKVNFMSISSLEGSMRVRAKVRYNHRGADCMIRMIGEDLVECIFDEPQRAITPGQAVVFYEKDYVVGGASIVCSCAGNSNEIPL
ncbi:MAG: tRNA 2-thiouridine(34) synthase MnmA [Lachnospiraceae bacterium]|nr:tRNA 2-thiouridine(34) synthase MnmA [Lachnospiraceae bacterium]